LQGGLRRAGRDRHGTEQEGEAGAHRGERAGARGRGKGGIRVPPPHFVLGFAGVFWEGAAPVLGAG
jgi:hypothetical protein